MNHIPLDATDKELIEFIDQWATLMEQEQYEDALAFTTQKPSISWTASLIKKAIKSYGLRHPNQHVTLTGKPTDISQTKEVSRWARNHQGEIGEIWYDLNIDGFTSDLTATFSVIESADGLEIVLNDIHIK